MYLNSVYYHLDIVHRVAIVDSHGAVVGHLQVAVKLLSSWHCFHIVVVVVLIAMSMTGTAFGL